MFWSAIKKAINSTLGTVGFKPLDQIIQSGFTNIETAVSTFKNSITNGTTLVGKAKEASKAIYDQNGNVIDKTYGDFSRNWSELDNEFPILEDVGFYYVYIKLSDIQGAVSYHGGVIYRDNFIDAFGNAEYTISNTIIMRMGSDGALNFYDLSRTEYDKRVVPAVIMIKKIY